MTGRLSFFGRFIRMPSAAAGAAIFGVILAASLAAPLVAPTDPGAIDLDAALAAPSPAHPFGTDAFGRDVLARVLHGARVSLGVGFLARTISLLLGLVLGALAGYFGGRCDSLLMRLADITFAYPTLLLLIAVTAVLSPSLVTLFVTLGVVGWASVARLVRAQVLTVKEREFVQAARSSGAGHATLLVRHILPQCLAPVVVIYTLGLGMTIMAEASLSFLGLGVQPPDADWGSMVKESALAIPAGIAAPLYPAAAIGLLTIGVNMVVDWLLSLHSRPHGDNA